MPRASTPLLISFIVSAATLTACSRSVDIPAPAESPAASTPVVEAPAPATFKAFQIGALAAFALRDGGNDMPNDTKVLGAGQTPEAVAAVLSAAGLPTDTLHLDIDPLLVKAGERVLLFDTGAGTNFGPDAGKLQASLGAAGVDPQSITDIFISHVHGDHVGGLINEQGALQFPNATIHISKLEWAFLTGMTPDTAKNSGLPQHDALVAAMKPKLATFAAGAELLPGLVKAVQIKGHTPGHSGYMITSGKDSLFYVGDSMHHSIISVQKPEWVNNFDVDHAVGAATRTALIAQLAKSGQRIYAVHFPFPNVGKIDKQGDRFVWVGEE